MLTDRLGFMTIGNKTYIVYDERNIFIDATDAGQLQKERKITVESHIEVQPWCYCSHLPCDTDNVMVAEISTDPWTKEMECYISNATEKKWNDTFWHPSQREDVALM